MFQTALYPPATPDDVSLAVTVACWSSVLSAERLQVTTSGLSLLLSDIHPKNASKKGCASKGSHATIPRQPPASPKIVTTLLKD